MTAQMQNVFSSRVNAIGHDPDTNSMVVTWANGRQSVYEGVPADLVASIAKSPSVGSRIHNEIIPNYKHSYL